MDNENIMENKLQSWINGFEHNKNYLHENLVIGAKIRIGKKYAEYMEYHSFKEGQLIELIEGVFDEYNGLYCYNSTAPSIKSEYSEFDSIYHLFGNNFERWMDNEIVT